MSLRASLRVALVGIGLFLTVSPDPIRAQHPQGATYDSFGQAVAVLEAGFEAVGGRELIGEVQDLGLLRIRSVYSRGQERRPATLEYGSTTEKVTFAFTSRRISAERSTTHVNGYQSHLQWLLDLANREGFRVNLFGDPDTPPTPLPYEQVVSNWSGWNRILPHLALRQADEHRSSLRYVGQQTFDGRLHEAISYADGEGQIVTLYLDSDGHLLTHVETVAFNPVFGDIVETTSFHGFEDIAGIRIPRHAIASENGIIVERTLHVDVRIDTGLPEEFFAGAPEHDRVEREEFAATVEGLGEGAYLAHLGPNLRSLFMEIDDQVIVVEAPMSSEVGEQLVQLIRQTLPSKRLAYVVPTHHHWDHLGGVRALISAGARVLTTTGNAPYIAAMVEHHRLVEPDRLTRSPLSAQIDTFHGQHVFGGGALRLIDVGPTDHAEEIVVAYVPALKMLFQADLFFAFPGPEGSRRLSGAASARRLAEATARHSLEVEHVLGVHGLPASLDDLMRTANSPQGRLVVPSTTSVTQDLGPDAEESG